MTDDLTINDGTVSRVYKTTFGGRTRINNTTVEHKRKTAEFDDTPESLIMRQSVNGKTHVWRAELSKTKVVDGVTYMQKTFVTHTSVPGVFTQTESENQLKEVPAMLNTSGLITDVVLGGL